MKKTRVNKNILILHGWNASPNEHWFEKARQKWTKIGIRVEVPHLPGNYFPNKEEWLNIIGQFNPDESWILIGHSLGGVAILKFLENAQKPIGKAILVATPLTSMHFGALDNFYKGGFNWQAIKQNCPIFELLYEDNDPAVPLEHGQKFAEYLDGNLTVVRGYTHFHEVDLNMLEKVL